MCPDARFPAPRLNFSVGERRVSFEDVNQKELKMAELSRCSIRSLINKVVWSLLQLLCHCNRGKSWQGEECKSKADQVKIFNLAQLAAYLAMGGTLDGDRLLSTSGWQVQLLTGRLTETLTVALARRCTLE